MYPSVSSMQTIRTEPSSTGSGRSHQVAPVSATGQPGSTLPFAPRRTRVAGASRAGMTTNNVPSGPGAVSTVWVEISRAEPRIGRSPDAGGGSGDGAIEAAAALGEAVGIDAADGDGDAPTGRGVVSGAGLGLGAADEHAATSRLAAMVNAIGVCGTRIPTPSGTSVPVRRSDGVVASFWAVSACRHPWPLIRPGRAAPLPRRARAADSRPASADTST